MRIMRSLYHVNLSVKDWDKMIDFYVNVCGFEQAFTVYAATLNRQLGWEVKEGDETRPLLTHIRVSPHSYLELANGTSSGKEVTSPAGSPLNHLALEVEDLAATAQYMAEKGYPLFKSPTDRTPVDIEEIKAMQKKDAFKVAWLLDPEGHLFEVMQPVGETFIEKFDRENPYTE